jgi:hypothetical protein
MLRHDFYKSANVAYFRQIAENGFYGFFCTRTILSKTALIKASLFCDMFTSAHLYEVAI